MNTVARNIKRLRRERGLTQDALAEKLFVTRQAVSNWEVGKNQPDIDMLAQIAEVLDTDANELIYGTRKNEYPRFQKQYVLSTGVCLLCALLWLALIALLLPWLTRLVNTTYAHIGIRTLLALLLPALLFFSIGWLIPSAASLWIDTRFSHRRKLLIAAFLLVLPSALLLIDSAVGFLFPGYPALLCFSAMTHDWLKMLLLILLPLLSGVLCFAGTNRG